MLNCQRKTVWYAEYEQATTSLSSEISNSLCSIDSLREDTDIGARNDFLRGDYFVQFLYCIPPLICYFSIDTRTFSTAYWGSVCE